VIKHSGGQKTVQDLFFKSSTQLVLVEQSLHEKTEAELTGHMHFHPLD